jgi:hypothetical protein
MDDCCSLGVRGRGFATRKLSFLLGCDDKRSEQTEGVFVATLSFETPARRLPVSTVCAERRRVEPVLILGEGPYQVTQP